MLPDTIEMKFAVTPGEDTVKAMKLLSRPADEEYTVHFFEQKPVALLKPVDPLKPGLILRVRQPAAGDGDSTCKIRGPKAEAAAQEFGIDEKHGRKFEGDQNVGDLVDRPSFSITLEPPPVAIAAVLSGAAELQEIFGSEADGLLQAAGATWGSLLAYGPIHARKWKKLELPGFHGKVTVELWKAGPVELLEISDKKDRDKATAFAEALKEYMTGEKVGVAQLPGSKTEFALANVQPFALPPGGEPA